jgi:hypothetical protein
MEISKVLHEEKRIASCNNRKQFYIPVFNNFLPQHNTTTITGGIPGVRDGLDGTSIETFLIWFRWDQHIVGKVLIKERGSAPPRQVKKV